MGLKEAIERFKPGIVEKDVPGIGVVKIKRLTVAEATTIDASSRDALFRTTVLAAVLDDEGKPFFKHKAELAWIASGILAALFQVCDEVNDVSGRGLPEAEKKCAAP